MENITIENLYDLTRDQLRQNLFTEAEYPWEVLPRIHDFYFGTGQETAGGNL